MAASREVRKGRRRKRTHGIHLALTALLQSGVRPSAVGGYQVPLRSGEAGTAPSGPCIRHRYAQKHTMKYRMTECASGRGRCPPLQKPRQKNRLRVLY